MRKSRSTTITLPLERVSQLRSIAAARGLSLTELIYRYIESEIRAGAIPDEVPGFRIEVVRGRIELNIQGRTITLSKTEGGEIANALSDVNPYCSLELENGNLHLEIRRRGRGLVVRFLKRAKMQQWSRQGLSRSTIPWTRQGLSHSTARDLARRFRAVLKQ
jgi:hypothetical protein